MRHVLICLSAAATLSLGRPVAAAEFVAPESVFGVASASDSDTLRIQRAPFAIRLYGIAENFPLGHLAFICSGSVSGVAFFMPNWGEPWR